MLKGWIATRNCTLRLKERRRSILKEEKKETKKNKRLYLAALCGVLAISGAVYAGTRGSNEKGPEKNLVDLNEEPTKAPVLQQEPTQQAENPINQGDDLLANAGEQTPEPKQEQKPVQNPAATQPPVQKPAANQGITAQEPAVKEDENPAGLTAQTGVETQVGPETQAEQFAKQNEKENNTVLNSIENEEIASVMNPTADDLKFSDEEGLCWPVEGNVVKNYSADQMVYFETLQQFRTNPAVFISGEVGTDVVAAADGIVQEIKKEDKTGQTLVLDIGSGYSLVYGHLAEVSVKEGDYLEEGSAFAKLAPVTKYYQIEGNHLYFQVLKDGESMNPMLLIR